MKHPDTNYILIFEPISSTSCKLMPKFAGINPTDNCMLKIIKTED